MAARSREGFPFFSQLLIGRVRDSLLGFRRSFPARAPEPIAVMTERRRCHGFRLRPRWHAGQTRSARRQSSGAVYVEVLLTILPVLVFFFGLLQLALLYTGRLVVRHAAQRAARSAVVVLEDDPKLFGGTPQGSVTYHAAAGEGAGGQEQLLRQLSDVLGVEVPVGALQGVATSEAGPRLAAIQRAAYLPLAALAPAPETLQRTFGLETGALAGSGNLARFVVGSLLYNRAAVMVTLRKPDGSVAHCVGPTEDVTVRVTYLYTCTMPLVSALMCSTLQQLSGLDRLDAATQGYYRSVGERGLAGARSAGQELQGDLQRAGEAAGGLSTELQYAASPELLLPFLSSKARFKLISAEATLPNQGAHYYERAPCPDPSGPVAER
jgi:hypothetical protein